MILLRICGKDEQQMERIAEALLREKLVIDVNIKRHVDRAELVDGDFRISRLILMTAKTKALLFGTVDERIRELSATEIPEIYSLPIVNMDWDQTKQLRRDLKQV